LAAAKNIFQKVRSFFSKKKKSDETDNLVNLEQYRQQLEENPKNYRIRLKLAETLLALGREDEAVHEYNETANMYTDHGFSPMAVAVYKKILKIDPEHLEANLNLARIYKLENLNADAITYYQQVFAIHQEAGRQEEAVAVLEKILEIAPDREKFRQQFRQFLPELEEPEKSSYSDLIITDRSPDSNLEMGADKEGDDFFDLGAELSGELSTLNADVAAGLQLDSEEANIGVEQVFETLKKTVQENRGDAGDEDVEQQKFHYNMALAYREVGMLEQALEESRIVMNFASFRVRAFLLTGRIYRDLDQLSEALSQFQQGLREVGLNRQDFLSLKYELGLTFREMNEIDRALETFREVYLLDPEYKNVSAEIAALEEGAEII